MSIDPRLTYLSIYFNGPNNEKWSIAQPTADLLAGLVLGLFTMLNEIENLNRGSTIGLFIEIAEQKKYIVAYSIYNLRDMLDPYYNTKRQFWGTEIIQDLNVQEYLENDFGWLIYNADDHFYKLYRFVSTEFIQGFITICNAFQVDFRDYIAGPPFKYNHGAAIPTYYQINGYDIPLSPLTKDDDDYNEEDD